MTYSVIDIGSNTVKCGVYEVRDQKPVLIDFYTSQLGIIAKIENGILPAVHIDSLADTINSYIRRSSIYGDGKIFSFATESLRRVTNLEEVCATVRNKCKLEIELVSGETEAQLSYIGFMNERRTLTEGIMADMGGGSTEILKFTENGISALNSFKFGCLHLKQKFVKGRFPTKEENDAIHRHVTEQLCAHPWVKDQKTLCLIGGTGKAIIDIAVQLGYKQPDAFERDEFNRLFERLCILDDDTVSLLETHIPSRAETIIPGMCAYKAILGYISAENVIISCAGIREGYLINKLKEDTND